MTLKFIRFILQKLSSLCERHTPLQVGLWLFLPAGVLLTSCNDQATLNSSPPEVSAWEMNALNYSDEIRDTIAARSPRKSCPHEEVYLAGISWSIVTGSPYDFSTKDIVEIGEDCFFRSAHCGTLGYIIEGGESYYRGIVRIQLVGHEIPRETCYRLGEYLCGYVEDGAGELRLSCSLTKLAEGPFQ